MNADQLRGVGGAAFQLGNVTLAATVVGPLVADPEHWPRSYAILVASLTGMTMWTFLWSWGFYLLGRIGSED